MRLLVRFLGFLFAAGTVVFLVGVAATAGMIWHFSKDLPDYSQLQDYEPPVMTRVHAADGALLGEYSKERRLYLPIQAMPARWGLSGIHAVFVSPGQGKALRARAQVIHHGSMTGVARTEIRGPDRRRVLEATTTHWRR